MLQSIWHFILSNVLAVHYGGTAIKFKSLLMLSVPLMVPAGILGPISFWIDQNSAYVLFVLVAIAVDHILGSCVHYFVENDFTLKKNIIGLVTKLSLVLMVGVLFEGFQYLYSNKTPVIEGVLGYLLAITRMMVFLYPASSAFVNSSIISGGKIPPAGWLNAVSEFNKSMNISKFRNNENRNKTRDDSRERE